MRLGKRIQLYLSAEHPCDYLGDEISSSQFVDPDLSLSTPLYSQLAEQGFRRSSSHIYRPMCPNCTACAATRLPVSAFKANRNQRRVLKKNSDLTLSLQPARYRDEYFELYRRYQHSRHAGGSMAESSADDFSHFLISDWCETFFLEYRLGEQLVAVAVTDRLDDGFSAVYTFFEPDLSSRSLGVLSVLKQIEETLRQGKEWLYLGYWIERCQKMAYKTNYQPLQGFIDNHWQEIG